VTAASMLVNVTSETTMSREGLVAVRLPLTVWEE
jgi:hypothetical protein